MHPYDGHPDIARTLERQHGLITRLQVLDTGMTPEHLNGLVRTGRWVLVRRGVYMPAHLWEALDPYDGQQRMRARGAHLQLRRAHVLSHESAARELGLPILRPETDLIHVTRRGVRGGRVEHGVKHHLAPFRHDEVVEMGGIPVLDRARTRSISLASTVSSPGSWRATRPDKRECGSTSCGRRLRPWCAGRR